MLEESCNLLVCSLTLEIEQFMKRNSYVQISEKVKPHPVVVNILTKVEDIIPKWKIVPAKDVIDSAFKDPVKREEVLLSFCFLVLSIAFFFFSMKSVL